MKVLILETQLREIVNHYYGLINGRVQLREDSSCDIFTRTTRRPDYDDTLNDVTPRIMKDLKGTIVKMSPDEYFQKCATLQRTTVEKQYSYIDPNRVDALMEKINANVKVDIPMIDFINNFQEGRHRAYLAKKLGCEQMEVAVFTKLVQTTDDDDEVITINDGKWDDVFTDNEGTFVSYDYTDRKQMEMFYSLFDSPQRGLTEVIYDIMKGREVWSKNIEPGPVVDIDRIKFEKKPEKLIDLMVEVISKNIGEKEYYENKDNEGDTLDMVLKYRSFDELFYEVIYDWSDRKPKIKELKNYILSMVAGIFEYVKYHEDYNSLEEEIDRDYKIKFGGGVIKLYIDDTKEFGSSVNTYQNFKEVLEDRISRYTYKNIENYIKDNYYYSISVRDVNEFLSKYIFSS